MLDDADPEGIALALGVYRHGGRVGVSGPTRNRPGFALYLNRYLLHYCDRAAHAKPIWSSVQLTNRGAEAHKELANTPGSFNFTIGVGDYTGAVVFGSKMPKGQHLREYKTLSCKVKCLILRTKFLDSRPKTCIWLLRIQENVLAFPLTRSAT